MSDYALHKLDDKKFEKLAANVVGWVYDIAIKTYPKGKDRGCDGAGRTKDGKEVVIQAKHTEKEAANLTDGKIRSIFGGEVEKVKALVKAGKCHIYFAVTNYVVSVGQENKLRELFEGLQGLERIEILGKDTLLTHILKMPPKYLSEFPPLRSKDDRISDGLRKKYKEDRETYKDTSASNEAKALLQMKNYVGLFGEQKSGKSRMLRYLAVETDPEDTAKLVKILNPLMFRKLSASECNVFMIEHIFGKTQLNVQQTEMWDTLFDEMTLSVSINNKIIISCRNDIYKQAGPESQGILSEGLQKFLDGSFLNLSKHKDLQNIIRDLLQKGTQAGGNLPKQPSSPPSSPAACVAEVKSGRGLRKRTSTTQSSSEPTGVKTRRTSQKPSSLTRSSSKTKGPSIDVDVCPESDSPMSGKEVMKELAKEAKRDPSRNKLEDELKAPYDVIVSSLILRLECPDLQVLESLWDAYLSDRLGRTIEKYLVTKTLKERIGASSVTLGTYVSPDDYLKCFRHFQAGKHIPRLTFHRLTKAKFTNLAVSAVEDAYDIHLYMSLMGFEEISAVRNGVKICLSGEGQKNQKVVLTSVFAVKDDMELSDEKMLGVFGFDSAKEVKKMADKSEVDVYFVVTNYKLKKEQQNQLVNLYKIAGIKRVVILDVNHLKILVHKSFNLRRILLHLVKESIDISWEDDEKTKVSKLFGMKELKARNISEVEPTEQVTNERRKRKGDGGKEALPKTKQAKRAKQAVEPHSEFGSSLHSDISESKQRKRRRRWRRKRSSLTTVARIQYFKRPQSELKRLKPPSKKNTARGYNSNQWLVSQLEMNRGVRICAGCRKSIRTPEDKFDLIIRHRGKEAVEGPKGPERGSKSIISYHLNLKCIKKRHPDFQERKQVVKPGAREANDTKLTRSQVAHVQKVLCKTIA